VKPALFIVATPIGNLEDITLRALRVLKESDAIFAEDTRVTKKLCNYYGIGTPIKRYDEHTHIKVSSEIRSLLEAGKSVALVTDAGTPGIADPGWRLVAELEQGRGEAYAIHPIPGASSLVAVLSISGIDGSNFSFKGFIPHKKGRETFFKNLAGEVAPVVVFESPHRLLKTLESLSGLYPNRTVQVYREITKLFESKIVGTAEEVLSHYKNHQDTAKGECILIILPE
jgi:16S rRNA (cytidine1402-2'-O)-methyltransferase